jgi:hypothetical protein
MIQKLVWTHVSQIELRIADPLGVRKAKNPEGKRAGGRVEEWRGGR